MVPVVKLQSLAAMEIVAGGGGEDHKSPQAASNGNTSSMIISVPRATMSPCRSGVTLAGLT
jgi:hypothetical protein